MLGLESPFALLSVGEATQESNPIEFGACSIDKGSD